MRILENSISMIIIKNSMGLIKYNFTENQDYVFWQVGNKNIKLYIPSACDTTEGYDMNMSLKNFSVNIQSDKLITICWEYKSNQWEKKIYLDIYECFMLYHMSVYGTHLIDVIHYFEGIDKKMFIKENTMIKHFNDYEVDDYSYLRKGSTAKFEAIFSPEPNAYNRNEFNQYEKVIISAEADIDFCGGNYAFNPTMLCYCSKLTNNMWMVWGIAEEKGQYLFSEYLYNGGAEFGFSLNCWGLKQVKEEDKLPTMIIGLSNDKYEGLEKYNVLLKQKFLKDIQYGEIFEWWRYPKVCGWGEQAYIGDLFRIRSPYDRGKDTGTYDACTQRNYEHFIDTLDMNDIPWKIIIIDARWSISGGEKKIDIGKWSHMREFVDKMHEMNKKVILWFGMWETEGLDSRLCITYNDKGFKALENRAGRLKKYGGYVNGQKIAPDPTIPEFQKFMIDCLKKLFGNKINDLNIDGIKLDYVSATPGLYGLDFPQGSKRLFGIELLKYYQSFLYKEIKKIKRDALIIGQSCNAYFIDCTDMIRIGDLYSPSYSIINEMIFRAKICRIVDTKWLIDMDGWPVPSLNNLMECLDTQIKLGTPSLYYITHLDTTGEEIGTREYKTIREIWEQYIRELKTIN